jgi:excisionase family DNA binding protein
MNDRIAYPITEAAEQIGISRSRLYTLKDEGQIEFTRIGGRVVVTASELARFLAAQPRTGLRAASRIGGSSRSA